MVMEYLPLGQLDVYLANPVNRKKLKPETLVEASVALANALYYMVNFNHINWKDILDVKTVPCQFSSPAMRTYR